MRRKTVNRKITRRKIEKQHEITVDRTKFTDIRNLRDDAEPHFRTWFNNYVQYGKHSRQAVSRVLIGVAIRFRSRDTFLPSDSP